MNRFFSVLIGAIMLIAMSSNAQAQNPYRGGTGYDGGWGSKRQATEMVVYRGYPVNYNTCWYPERPRCYQGYGPGGYGGGGYGYAPGYSGNGTSVNVGVSYSNARYGSNRGSSLGVGVGFSSASWGGNRATNVGVNLAYSSTRWGRR